MCTAASKLRTIASNFNSIVAQRNYSKPRTMTFLLAPPASVRGMTLLDREAFETTIDVPCFKMKTEKLSDVMETLKKYILKRKRLKPIQNFEDNAVVYLHPKKVTCMNDVDVNDRELLKNYVDTVESTKLTLKYENWYSNDIFKAVLPEDVEIPTSFSQVGHIVHLNLRDSQLIYKNLIGQVFLDNVPNARTVVNKLNTIDTTYRHFSMEILAGDDDTITTTKENGYTYKFDFAKVYWNSRLSTEHAKLLKFMKQSDVLYDVFAGVGPFAIPAARKGIRVLANDLNPESYKWLQTNAVANKCTGLQFYNKDGRDFLTFDVKKDLIRRRDDRSWGNEHIAMNLPALAVEFLDVLRNWFNDDDAKRVCERPPTLHVYCFVKTDKDNDDPSKLAKILVEDKIGCSLDSECLRTIHHVRNVSPNKEMMRVSFYLTENMINAGEPARKKSKIDDNAEVLKDVDVVGQDGKEQESEQDEECVQSCSQVEQFQDKVAGEIRKSEKDDSRR